VLYLSLEVFASGIAGKSIGSVLVDSFGPVIIEEKRVDLISHSPHLFTFVHVCPKKKNSSDPLLIFLKIKKSHFINQRVFFISSDPPPSFFFKKKNRIIEEIKKELFLHCWYYYFTPKKNTRCSLPTMYALCASS
jgi:hypothetical protein